MIERRMYPHFRKQYTVIFALRDEPHKTYDMSQLLDISRGGLKFFSYVHYPVGVRIVFHIRFPFLYPEVTTIEGEVVGTEAVLQGMTYKIRIKFINLTPAVMETLLQMEKVNLKSLANEKK